MPGSMRRASPRACMTQPSRRKPTPRRSSRRCPGPSCSCCTASRRNGSWRRRRRLRPTCLRSVATSTAGERDRDRQRGERDPSPRAPDGAPGAAPPPSGARLDRRRCRRLAGLARRTRRSLRAGCAAGGAPADGRRRDGKGVDSLALAEVPGLERRHGHPVEVLLAAADSADLVVLGSRGLHGLPALGSVSERVAHRATCSVLVVREPSDRETWLSARSSS
jgi:Universal stress protein family